MKNSADDDACQNNSRVISKPVSEEANKRRSDEDGEGENHVDQGDVDVSDTNVLHVDGEVGEEGEGGGGKEEESELQWEQFSINTAARLLEKSTSRHFSLFCNSIQH